MSNDRRKSTLLPQSDKGINVMSDVTCRFQMTIVTYLNHKSSELSSSLDLNYNDMNVVQILFFF